MLTGKTELLPSRKSDLKILSAWKFRIAGSSRTRCASPESNGPWLGMAGVSYPWCLNHGIRWMEEIVHYLGWLIPYKHLDKPSTNWCGISSIHSIIAFYPVFIAKSGQVYGNPHQSIGGTNMICPALQRLVRRSRTELKVLPKRPQMLGFALRKTHGRKRQIHGKTM